MGVGELIEHIRALYVTSLQQVVVARPELQPEPVATSDGALTPSRGERTWPRRHDAVEALSSGSEVPVVVNSEGVLGFEPISFAWGDDLNVHLMPFCWDFVEFDVPRSGLKNLRDNLGDWHERWFTPTGQAKSSPLDVEEGLAGVLHELSGLDHSAESVCFKVDFGSAPINCFEDLLDVLGASGATTVTVREAV